MARVKAKAVRQSIRRDVSTIAKAAVISSRPALPLKSLSRPRLNLLPFEDRRSYHPLQAYAPPATLGYRSARRIVERHPLAKRKVRPGVSYTPGRSVLAFAVPDKVAVCVRRARRREVMFASGRAGKRGQRRPRRNYWSSVAC